MFRKIFNQSLCAICCGSLFLLLCSYAAQARKQNRAAQQAPLQPAAMPLARGNNAERPQPNQLLSLLNLSPAQRAEIREIRVGIEAERRAVTQRVRAAQRALEKAIYVDDTTEAELEKYVQEAAAAQAAATRLRAFTELRIRRVLTAKQLEVLRDLRRQARAKQVNQSMQNNARLPLGKGLSNRLN